MNSIDNKVVEMRFDNSQFESAVAQTMSTLEKFKSKLNFEDSGKGLDKLGKQTGNYQYTLQDVGESLSNLEKRFDTMGTVGARVFEKITDSAYGFVTKGIGSIVSSITQGGMSRAMNLEQAKFQLQGIVGSAERVHEIIYDEILPELQGTPFSLDQAAVVLGQLAASGRSATEDVKQGTRAIAGVAAMTNRSFEEIGRVFTKVSGNGKVMGVTFQELSSRGLNAAADMAKYMNGVLEGTYNTTQDVTDAIKYLVNFTENGKLFTEMDVRSFTGNKNTKDIFSYDIFVNAMDAIYGEQAKKSTTMYSGALEDLKAALARVGAESATVRLDFLRNAFNALVPAVDAVNGVLKTFTNSARSSDEQFKDLPEYLKPFTGSLSSQIQEVGWSFMKLFVQLDKNNDILRYTDKTYKDLGFQMRETKSGSLEFYKTLKDGSEEVHDNMEAVTNPTTMRAITALTYSFTNIVAALGKAMIAIGKGIRDAFPKVTLSSIANMAEAFQRFTSHLILSEESLERIRWITRALFTPFGLAIREVVFILKKFVSILSTAYSILSPLASLITSFFGMISKVISGLGVLINNAASFGYNIFGRLFGAFSKVGELTLFQKAVDAIKSTLERMTAALDSAGDKAYAFLTNLKTAERLQPVWETLSKIFDKISTFFTNIKSKVGSFMGGLNLGEQFANLGQAFNDIFNLKNTTAFEKLKEFSGWLKDISPFSGMIGSFSINFGKLGTILKLLNFKPIRLFFNWIGQVGKLTIQMFKDMVENDFFTQFFRNIFPKFNAFKKWEGFISNRYIPALQAMTDMLPKLMGFEKWGDVVAALGRKLGAAATGLAKFFGLFGEGVANDVAKGANTISAALGPVYQENIRREWGRFAEMFGQAGKKLGEAIGNWLKDNDPNKVKRLVLSLSIFGTALYYLYTINQAARTFKGLTKVLEVVQGAIGVLGHIANSISGIFTALKNAVKAVSLIAYMHAFAIALIGIATAMLIISKIPREQLLSSALVVAGMLGGITLLMVAANAMSKNLKGDTPKTMLYIAGVVAAIAGSIIAIAGSLYLLATMEGDLENAVFAVIAIFTMVGVMFVFMSQFAKKTKVQKIDFSSAGWAMVGIATGCRVMASAIAELGAIPEEELYAGIKAVSAIMLFMSIFALLAGFGTGQFKAALGLTFLALAVTSLTKVVKSFKKLKPGELANVERGIDLVSDLIMSLTILAGVIGLAQKFGGGMWSGMAMILAMVVAIKTVAKAAVDIGKSLNEQQIKNVEEILYGFAILMGLLAGIMGLMGGGTVAIGAGSMVAVAAGIYLVAQAILELGSATDEQLTNGLNHLVDALFAMGIAVAIFAGVIAGLNKFFDITLDPKASLSLLAMAAGMYVFAQAIALMASMPYDTLCVAITAVIGVLIIAGGVMAAFSALSPGLLAVAAAFALLGVAAIGVGAGIFLLTLALSALIPLITTLDGVDREKLAGGLEVLAQVAEGLATAMDSLTASLFAFGGALIVVGAGMIVIGLGAALIGVGFVIASVGVFLLSGAFIVLFETLSEFFPSVVKPAEGALAQLTQNFTNALSTMSGSAQASMEDMKNIIPGSVEESTAEGAEKAEAGSQEIADNLNPYQYLDMDGDMAEYAEKFGFAPGAAGDAWTANEDQLTGAVGNTEEEIAQLQEKFTTGWADTGEGGMSELANGYIAGGGQPISALSLLFPKIGALHGKLEKMNERAGQAQMQKMSGGMASKKSVVTGTADNVGTFAVSHLDKSGDAYTTGSNVSGSFASGIASKIREAANAAASIAQAAVDNARKKLDINSPSKVFIALGEGVDEGFIKGMYNMQSQVASTAGEVVGSSIDAVTQAMMSCAAAFDSDMDFTPTITPVVDLTEVRQGVNGINGMFGQVFGLNAPASGRLNAALAASGFEATKDQNAELYKGINSLTSTLDSMTETMNSRSLNIYNTIDGASDPTAFADELTNCFKLKARTM